jgi:hypothetical protein
MKLARQREEPIHGLIDILREAQHMFQRPPEMRGATQRRFAREERPDGTLVEIAEESTYWEFKYTS